MPAMLPSTNPKASAPRTSTFSVLISPAHPYRYRRFACPLAGTDARLAEKRGSVTPSFQGTSTPYLLPVRLAHQLLILRSPPPRACSSEDSNTVPGILSTVGRCALSRARSHLPVAVDAGLAAFREVPVSGAPRPGGSSSTQAASRTCQGFRRATFLRPSLAPCVGSVS